MSVTISATSGAQTSTETCRCCQDRIDKNLEWSTTLSYPSSNCTGEPSYAPYDGHNCVVFYGPFVRYFENATYIYYAGRSGSSFGMKWHVVDREQIGFYYPGDANTSISNGRLFTSEIVITRNKSTGEITTGNPPGLCVPISDGTSQKSFWRLV